MAQQLAEMSAPRVGGRYRSRYQSHEVLVTRDSDGRWQVVDAAGSEFIVETLTGHDDRLDQALALARDYAAEQQAYQDGRRESDPLPRRSVNGVTLDTNSAETPTPDYVGAPLRRTPQ